jgi:hypothetical protein
MKNDIEDLARLYAQKITLLQEQKDTLLSVIERALNSAEHDGATAALAVLNTDGRAAIEKAKVRIL